MSNFNITIINSKAGYRKILKQETFLKHQFVSFIVLSLCPMSQIYVVI